MQQLAVDTGRTGQVSTSAAEIYDRFFLPALFGSYASRVAAAARIGAGDSVLDVACGTGVLTIEAQKRCGASGRVAGLDRNPGMLAQARTKSAEITWHEGLAEQLPFDDATFDVVVSQFGLMFFDDRAKALKEMLRVLKPNGRLCVAVWAGLEKTPGYSAMVSLLRELFGAEIASALHAPYVLGNEDELRNLFDAAGIAGARIALEQGDATFPSIDDWVHTDIKGWTLADAINDEQFELLQREANKALSAYELPDGTVRFAHPAIFVSAVKPS